MYKYSLFVLCLNMAILATSCQKDPPPEALNPTLMKDLKASAFFSWETHRVISLKITNAPKGIVVISNNQHTLRLATLFSDGSEKALPITLTLPAYYTSISVNGQNVKLESPALEVDLTPAKSVSINYSMLFNGLNQWIKVPSSAFQYTNQLSFAVWVKANGHKSAKIIQKGDWDGSGLGQDLWEGWQASFAMNDGTSTDLNIAQRPVTGQWYHLASTYDGSVARLYIDGLLVKSIVVNKTLRQNNRDISIAADNGNQKFFGGNLDEPCIWNTALTAAQVQLLMTTGTSAVTTGMVACYSLNEGSGSTAYDASQHQYNGQIIGATYSTDVGYGGSLDNDGDGISNGWDDYPEDATRAFNNYWPQTGWSSLAFEDLWPAQGDYDFNDLVTDYRYTVVTNAQNKVVEVFAAFAVKAIGGSFHNGFGFQLTSSAISQDQWAVTGSMLTSGYISLNQNGLETGQTRATFIAFDDAWSLASPIPGYTGINTTPGSPVVLTDTINLHITLPSGIYTQSDLNLPSFNPFLIVNGSRGREVHLPDHEPTSLADVSLLGTGADDSYPATGRYYKTTGNLPWAVNIADRFEYPIEKADILAAHLKLAAWAQSNGNLFTDWYLDKPGYRNPVFIFNR
jgi:LruC domain-containing protein